MKKLFRKIVKYYFELNQIAWEVKKEFIQSKNNIEKEISEIKESEIRENNVHEIFRFSIYLKSEIYTFYDDCLIRLKRNNLGRRNIVSLHERAKSTAIRLLDNLPIEEHWKYFKPKENNSNL